MLGRIAYALIFTLLVPAGLVAWSWATRSAVQLPAYHWPIIGWTLVALGIGLIAWAMHVLRTHGGGLPMNAFPPIRRVTTSAYAITAHPIYAGFVLACFGAALAFGSASGLWLVAPAAALGCVALVYGYERDATRARLGEAPAPPLLRLPRAEDRPPQLWDRLSALFLVLLPWAILYEAVGHLPAPGAFDSRLAFEANWPVWEWTTPVYSAAYPLVLITPWITPTARTLRRFCIAGLIATAIATWFYIVLPVVAPPRPLNPDALFAWLLALERSDGLDGRNAFPAFHVTWSLLAAWSWSTRGRRWAIAGWTIATLIIVSCITTGMHALLDIPAGVVLFLAAIAAGKAWRRVIAATEWIANSWREWRIGPVRIISHAFFAGSAAMLGVIVAAFLAGPQHAPAIAITGLCAAVGGALWGQLLTGSKTLLRPFGYFGAVLGATIGVGIAPHLGTPAWTLAAALAAAAPWIVLIGRLRCLVQGCCHGRPTEHVPGIRYQHPRSRVCSIARLSGVCIHPTPLYSMASNLVLAPILLRLWTVGAPATMIVGVYLLLAGLSRFVEEHFRGEPQTQIAFGLRIYQWFAVASAVAGIVITCVSSSPATPAMDFDGDATAFAMGVGILFFIAMGVDLPDSNRRFSRLT